MAAKKRRKKHAGVSLKKPNEAKRMGWRARFKDPDTGREVYVRLPPELTNQEQREMWAVRKSQELARRRLELENGAARATGSHLKGTLNRYFVDHPQLRERTLQIYRNAADKLEAWAPSERIHKAEELTRAKLMGFRAELIRAPKRIAVKGGARGARAGTTQTRSAASVNQELRAIRTVLGYLIDLDLFPRLSHDDLRRALKRLEMTSEPIEFLRPDDCRQLLEAARRHDAARFVETRDEHEGKRELGTTRRYEPIAPFVFFVLCTGMRIGEAVAVEWRQVNLEALDQLGKEAGEITLSGTSTKTKRGRIITLEVSPALREVLNAMLRSSLKVRGDARNPVFRLTRNEADSAADRLRRVYGAPSSFSWQALRRTCGTVLTNAPGIFHGASAYRSAKQLGHSVQVAERAYVGLLRGISAEARSIESALKLEDLTAQLIADLDPQGYGAG